MGHLKFLHIVDRAVITDTSLHRLHFPARIHRMKLLFHQNFRGSFTGQ